MAGLGCSSLDELAHIIGECRRCALGRTRHELVLGAGDPEARVMLIGEAPGRSEDLKGEPFVGAAGKLLDELLSHAGLLREDVFIANVLKCRPPSNRNPAQSEIETCTPFLREQIRVICPDVLVTLGNFATRFVLQTDQPISKLHGTVQTAGRFTVLPVFHPAAALYDRSKRDVLLADFARLRELLLGRPPVNTEDHGVAAGPDPTVVSLDDVVPNPPPPEPVDDNVPASQEKLFS